MLYLPVSCAIFFFKKTRKTYLAKVRLFVSECHKGTQIATRNTRYVYAMRSIGRGAEAGRMLYAFMNLSQPPTRLALYDKRLINIVKLVSEETKCCAGSYSGKWKQ
ncbi:hypothetical protein NPIL_488621 [Nephila pilipes]|uniref:Uncharacterized protein n=1 Tax=Nephila pilipes TaxID=299642 RepID=A0A8X6TPI8_NEPPI|nr:hypothetical protein NPIL_488621 [Nephila pilipes]